MIAEICLLFAVCTLDAFQVRQLSNRKAQAHFVKQPPLLTGQGFNPRSRFLLMNTRLV